MTGAVNMNKWNAYTSFHLTAQVFAVDGKLSPVFIIHKNTQKSESSVCIELCEGYKPSFV